MKTEFCHTLAGNVSLELISETDEEYRLLAAIFRLNDWPVLSGKSNDPRDGASGFYIPLFNMTKSTQKAPT